MVHLTHILALSILKTSIVIFTTTLKNVFSLKGKCTYERLKILTKVTNIKSYKAKFQIKVHIKDAMHSKYNILE